MKEELGNLKRIVNFSNVEKDSLRLPNLEGIKKITRDQKDDLRSSHNWGNSDAQLNKSGAWMPNASIKSFITNPGSIAYSSKLSIT